MRYELQFNVAQLLKQPSGATRTQTVRASLEGLDPDILPRRPLEGRLTFLRTAQGVLVSGELGSQVELVCDRCLEPVLAGVRLQISEEFTPTINVQSGQFMAESRETEEALRIDQHHILDLTEVARQSILLGMPMHPLCRPDCRGLCQVCGGSRNAGAHDHLQEEIDPRLSRLRELL